MRDDSLEDRLNRLRDRIERSKGTIQELSPPLRTEMGAFVAELDGILGAFQAMQEELTTSQRTIAERRQITDEIHEFNAALEQHMTDSLGEVSASQGLMWMTSEFRDLVATLQKTLQYVRQMLHCSAGFIHLLNGEQGVLYLIAQQGLSPDTLPKINAFPSDSRLLKRVVERGEPLLMADLAAESDVTQLVDVEGSWAYLGIPVRSREQTLGLFSLIRRGEHPFVEQDLALLLPIAERIGNTISHLHIAAKQQQRMQELKVLYQADKKLHRHLHLEQVLQSLVDVAVDIGGADSSSFLIWDEQQEQLVTQVVRNLHSERIATASFALGEGIAGRAALSGDPIVVADVCTDPRVVLGDALQSEKARSLMCVPVKVAGEVFGIFSVNFNGAEDYGSPPTFSSSQQRLFLALAQRAALAIENAQLYEQAQQAAVLAERQRLARDLHDSVAQSIYSLSLFAETGRQLAEAGGQLEGIAHYLARIGEASQQALKEMRLLVYELRPPTLSKSGLASALRQRLEAVEERTTVNAQLLVDEVPELSLLAQEELYRIAQEALNNSLKHAMATEVAIHLERVGKQVILEINDNGRGFDPSSVNPDGGMGLVNMRERAERLGGRLQIQAAPGEGTQVTAIVMLNGDMAEESEKSPND